MTWLRRLAEGLDLTIADESELRGVLKGMALGLVIYCALLLGVSWLYLASKGG